MAVKNKNSSLLKKLTQQVRVLQKKEEQTRNKLRATLKKMHKLGNAYKAKLAKKMQVMQSKIVHAQSSTYIKMAANIERQMLKAVETKCRALAAAAAAKIEKKHAAKLTKSFAKKSKKKKKRVSPRRRINVWSLRGALFATRQTRL
jgi:hypothetical protein